MALESFHLRNDFTVGEGVQIGRLRNSIRRKRFVASHFFHLLRTYIRVLQMLPPDSDVAPSDPLLTINTNIFRREAVMHPKQFDRPSLIFHLRSM